MWLTTPAMSASDAWGAITMTTACEPSARAEAPPPRTYAYPVALATDHAHVRPVELEPKRSAELRGDDGRLSPHDHAGKPQHDGISQRQLVLAQLVVPPTRCHQMQRAVDLDHDESPVAS